jgi:hypothetical protein
MARQSTPRQASLQKRSVVPYICLAVAIVSVAASLILWKHQRDNKSTPGTRVIATTPKASTDLAITAFRAPEVWHCSPGSDNTVIVSWASTGAKSVAISVDNEARPFVSGLPAASQTSVPAPCAPASHTYRLTAESADGKHVTRVTTTKGV